MTVLAKAAVAGVCLLLMTGCGQDDRTMEGANDLTPVRYLVCGVGGNDCYVSARFQDFEGCLAHKDWSERLCSTDQATGQMVCSVNEAPLAKGRCTL